MPKQKVVRKKGDLTGAGKGDWIRDGVNLFDKEYKDNYDAIFGKKDILIANKIVAK
tara:strand:+ start:2231 stop:2398 length:168 start_codon:yes stop_codon:yes gene_type:complete